MIGRFFLIDNHVPSILRPDSKLEGENHETNDPILAVHGHHRCPLWVQERSATGASAAAAATARPTTRNRRSGSI